MTETEKILQEEFELLRIDLIKEHDRLGMRASGKTAESLEVESGAEFGRLIGDETWGALQFGRSPSSGGGNGDLIDAIKQWIKDKGIVSDIKNDNDNSTLAFLITRKIHREGWKRDSARNPIKGINVVTNVVTPKRMQSIIDRIGAELTLTFVSTIQKELETISL